MDGCRFWGSCGLGFGAGVWRLPVLRASVVGDWLGVTYEALFDSVTS